MKILFLTSRVDSPSFRFRVLQYIPYIEKDGWDVKIQEIPKNWFKRWLLFNRLDKFDIIFIQRKMLGNLELRKLRARTERLFYDFDDAIMLKHSSGGAIISRHREKRFRSIVKTADMVIAGNEYLANKVKDFSFNVVVIPTVIDTEKYFCIDRNYKEKVTIGWIGSESTLIYLNGIGNVLKRILNDFKNVELKIVCSSFSGLNIPGAILKKWNLTEEVSDLQGFDIGLMPLIDNEWARGKCGFKIIQYFSVGVPVVCSPVGVNCRIVNEGITGFFANNEDEWYEKVALLIKDKTLRLKMGEAARNKIGKEYSLNVFVPRLLGVLKGGGYG